MISISGLIICLVILFANIPLGLLVYTRARRERINQLFLMLAITITLWAVSNIVSDVTQNFKLAELSSYSGFVWAYLGVFTAKWFTHTLRGAAWKSIQKVIYGTLLIVGPIVACIPKAVYQLHTVTTFSYGPLFIPYITVLIVFLGLIINDFRLLYIHGSAAQRNQVKLMQSGFLVMAIGGLFTNALIPYFANILWVTEIGPLLSIIFVAAVAYAIAKHKLFDLRIFVLRATAYAFSVSLITAFFLVPAIWLASHIVHVKLSQKQVLLLMCLIAVLIFVYRYVRKLFDQITTTIFFRNFYDSQDVLDRLSEFLVRTLNAGEVQAGSKKILQTAIRTQRFEFWLAKDEGTSTQRDFKRLFLQNTTTNFVMLDDLKTEQPEARTIAKDIAIVVRLRTTSGDLGYMTLGYKDSGQLYSTQDKRLLSTAGDEIAISLQNALHFQEIQSFNETLQANVGDATRKLRATNEKLQALDTTKDEFITMASHQLRTPLTSVKGYLSMVLEGDAGKLNKQQTQLLTQSYISAQRMVYLIADLLNLSRLNTGKFVIEPTPVDLNEVVQGEIDQLRETAKSRGVSLNYEKPAAIPRLLLDETKIHQVVMNFIDNAIYYTPPGGTIVVTLKETPASIEYLVKDNGIGVPKAEQHKLFAKFFRAANARQARPDGTGLGLFMARKVIAAQGGAIIFHSEEGKGSSFGFRFSKAKHLAPMPSASIKDQVSK